MKKVFQTIHGQGKGNCLPAVIASLLEISIEDVPHFNDDKNWKQSLSDFLNSKGYEVLDELFNTSSALLYKSQDWNDWYYENVDCVNRMELLKDYDGIDGLFYAGIVSPGYYKVDLDKPPLHAIVVDKNYNIVHDPEEKYQNVDGYPMADKLGYNGIFDITIIQKIK